MSDYGRLMEENETLRHLVAELEAKLGLARAEAVRVAWEADPLAAQLSARPADPMNAPEPSV